MFQIGKIYWFHAEGKTMEFNIKGEVIEETPYLVKIKKDDGFEEILSIRQILGVNEVRTIEEEKNIEKEFK